MLTRAFARYGIDAQYLQLQACEIDLGQDLGLKLAGFNTPPLAVFVRGIPGGTLPQVITRLNILHTLKAHGIVVYNDGRAIERTVDKGLTSLILAQAGVPTPMTWVMENQQRFETLCRAEWALGHSLVIKPLFGSQGEGLERLTPDRALPPLEQFNGVGYVQRFVHDREGRYRDYRVFVIGGQTRAAMARYGIDWRNNVAQGARCEAITPAPALCEIAEAATQALDIDYAGVDIIETEEAGYQVIEVNSVPAWYGLQSVTSESIADMLAEDIVRRKLGLDLSRAETKQ
jgi:RimK family alpha-L-glutamate ligase